MTCKHRAILIMTRSVVETSTHIAKTRLDLRCGRPDDHDGPHRDDEHGEEWQDRGKDLTHLVRDETES